MCCRLLLVQHQGEDPAGNRVRRVGGAHPSLDQVGHAGAPAWQCRLPRCCPIARVPAPAAPPPLLRCRRCCVVHGCGARAHPSLALCPNPASSRALPSRSGTRSSSTVCTTSPLRLAARACWKRTSPTPSSTPAPPSRRRPVGARPGRAAADARSCRCCRHGSGVGSSAQRASLSLPQQQLLIPSGLPSCRQASCPAHLRVPRGDEQPGAQGGLRQGCGACLAVGRLVPPIQSRAADSHEGRSSSAPVAWTPRRRRCLHAAAGPSLQVNSYLEFKEEMLPRIRKLGYNAIQIMAIQARGPLPPGTPRATPWLCIRLLQRVVAAGL